MAYNPFASFRKNQKFWMAFLVLLAMVTFILGDRLTQQGAPNLRREEALGKVNGRDLTPEVLSDLRMQRNIANEFMRKFCGELVQKADDLMKRQDDKKLDEKGEQERRQNLMLATYLKGEFTERLKKPRYFEGGVKLEDLADFRMWLDEADRLDIHLDANAIRYLVDKELLWDRMRYSDEVSTKVMMDVRRIYQQANANFISQAVRDEFRVRIAQLAMLYCQPDQFNMAAAAPHEMKYKEPRVPLTLAQLWDFYRENRSEFDIAVIPVEAENNLFLGKVPEPTEAELTTLFNDYRKARYDPTSDKPGFEIPLQIKIQWLTADPSLPAYKTMAKVVAGLRHFSPGLVSAGVPPTVTAVQLAVGPLLEKTETKARYEVDAIRFSSPYHNVPLTSGDFLTGIIDYQLFETLPPPDDKSDRAQKTTADRLLAWSALVGTLAAPRGEFAAAHAMRHVMATRNHDDYKPLIQGEAKKRVPVFATVIASAVDGPLGVAAQWLAVSERPENLPLEIVEHIYQERNERILAQEYVTQTMQAVRKELEFPTLQGKKKAIDNSVDKLGKEHKFVQEKSAQFYNRYTIADAKEVDALKQAYMKYFTQLNILEGRGGTERVLKDSDFFKMFFDKSEPFSAAVGTNYVRAWPPATDINSMPVNAKPEDFQSAPAELQKMMVERMNRRFLNPNQPVAAIDLFKDAEKPILFWKSEEKPSSVPEKLEEVRDDVVKAWKLQKARELALAEAAKIADALEQPALVNLEAEVRTLAAPLKREPIALRNVAPLYTSTLQDRFMGKYSTFQLPRATFTYPRDDMAKRLMLFADPKKLLQLEDRDAHKLILLDKEDARDAVDTLNKRLFQTFRDSKGARPIVQVLTNQPRTAFYVTVLTKDPSPDIRGFEDSVKRAIGHQSDEFVQRAYDSMSKDSLQVLLRQLRERTKWEVTTDAEKRKGYDSDGPG